MLTINAEAQIIKTKVVDSASGQPLPYASIIFTQSSKFIYTNDSGMIAVSRDSLSANDTAHITFLGFKDAFVSLENLMLKPVIKMVVSSNQLSNVVVKNCISVKLAKANYFRGRPSSYIGPGPETKIIIISRYLNEKNVEGYIKTIGFYSNVNTSIPVRLHWYEWNKAERKPGNELTLVNLLYNPAKQGWNNFDIPDRTFYYDAEGIVLGIEFIYPEPNKKLVNSFKDEKAKLAWLNNMTHRWSLGMNDESAEPSFYQVNNGEMKAYKKDNDRGYNQPALRIVVTACKK